jgi:hypothetical protein
MASELTKAIYHLLSETRPVTAAGACHVLRGEFTPVPAFAEAERSLDWLVRNGVATRNPDRGFGDEYLRKERK